MEAAKRNLEREENAGAIRYLEQPPSQVDLNTLLETNHDSVVAFMAWFSKEQKRAHDEAHKAVEPYYQALEARYPSLQPAPLET